MWIDGNRPRLAGTRRTSMSVPGLVARVLTFAAGGVLLAVALMFSLVLLAFVIAAGLVGFGYLWWRTRGLRRHLREQPPGGHVIDGMATREAAPDERLPR